ncbi:hypothetical protein D3M72_10955, partial [Rodentibacter pneumotropicus]
MGSNTGINADVGTSSGSVTGTQAGTILEPIEEAETEVTDGYQEPTLPIVSEIEILQPLIDLKEELISKLNFNLPAGTC